MAVVMPLWLAAIAGVVLPFPWLDPVPMMAHPVYGLAVGAVFPVVEFE